MPTLGEVLAIVGGLAAFCSIVVFAWRMGATSQEMKNTKDRVAGSLEQFNKTIADGFGLVQHQLQDVNQFIRETYNVRQEWSAWRATVNARLDAIERQEEV